MKDDVRKVLHDTLDRSINEIEQVREIQVADLLYLTLSADFDHEDAWGKDAVATMLNWEEDGSLVIEDMNISREIYDNDGTRSFDTRNVLSYNWNTSSFEPRN